MRIKTMFLSMLATAALVGCSKDNINDGDNTPQDGNSYIAISIKSPASPGTRTGADVTDPATTEELKVTDAIYYGFNAEGVCVNAGELTITAGVGETPGESQPIAVDASLRQVFVVINPPVAIKTANATANGLTFAMINAAITTIDADISEYSGTDFMMTNSEGLAAVMPLDAATPTATPINVDRVVSKVVFTPFTANSTAGGNVPDGTTVEIKTFDLNRTNRSLFPYAEYVTYNVGKETSYRQDPNFALLTLNADGEGTAADAFVWLNNGTGDGVNEPTFVATAQYCIENTVSEDATNMNNLTSVLFSAKYAPSGFPAGESWFMFNNVAYTFEELKDQYNNVIALNAAAKANFDAFIDALNGDVADFGTFASLGDFTAAVGDPTSYRFATNVVTVTAPVTGRINLQYFKDAVCYYEAPISHDNNLLGDNVLGKWGTVRNNQYTIAINSIAGPGLSYIPDQTDNTILDNNNPNPEVPETPDVIAANIVVSVSMNPWSGWNQSVDL